MSTLFGEILTLSSEYGTIVFITVLFFILLFEGGNSLSDNSFLLAESIMTVLIISFGRY